MSDVTSRQRWLRRSMIVALLLAAIGVLLLAGGDLYDWIVYERVEAEQIMNGELVVGWSYVPRWGKQGTTYRRVRLWSQRTGMLVYDAHSPDEYTIQSTRWSAEGRIIEQTILEIGVRGEAKVSPPWWWGMKDQTRPTSPFDFAPSGRETR